MGCRRDNTLGYNAIAFGLGLFVASICTVKSLTIIAALAVIGVGIVLIKCR